MKFSERDGIDVYPVGLFRDWMRRRRIPMRRSLRYPWRQARQHHWRAVRNYFNGYLAECYGHPHNAGRGWTKRAALRRVERICATTPPPAQRDPAGPTDGGGA